MLFQPSSKIQRVGAMSFHPQSQGLQTAEGKEAIERSGYGPDSVLKKSKPLGQRQSGFTWANHHNTAHHIGMPVEIFRCRMNDDIEPEIDRMLDPRAGKGVVRNRY